MSTAFRFVAPAGAPISGADVLRAALAALTTDVQAGLRRAVTTRFGIRHALVTSTGRAGMTLLLRALRRLAPPDRTEVVLPSYTCYSLAASTIKAGLQPRLADVLPRTLDFDQPGLERIDCSRVLAIVATNLYGMPNDLPVLSGFARDRGVFLIDDAAQSMGARVGGRWSGTWGDAGLFSFDKGKPVSAIDGGVVVTSSDEVARALDVESRHLERARWSDAIASMGKVAAYAALLRPSLYWVPQRIPQLGLGRTLYDETFPVSQPERFLEALGMQALEHLNDYTATRAANATAILRAIRSTPGIVPVRPVPTATPTYLRLPVLFDSPVARETAIDALRQAGIGATGSYPASLVDVPQLQAVLGSQASQASGGRYIADRILTLPTHPYVAGGDIERMADVLMRASRSFVVCEQAAASGSPGIVCAE